MLSSILSQFKYPETDVQQVFFKFNELLKPLTTIEKNDKLGMINHTFTETNSFQSYIHLSQIKWKLYNDKFNYKQSFSRWWYNQQRESIYTNLEIIFSIYENFLKYIKTLLSFNQFNDLLSKITELNTSLLKGLANLKKTYTNDTHIISILDKLKEKITINLNE
tara:strand:+ start:4027 stop:4518 length:492 start_codon:yes stop_codon:yes gene_type:complete